jgi:hypothetical protein
LADDPAHEACTGTQKAVDDLVPQLVVDPPRGGAPGWFVAKPDIDVRKTSIVTRRPRVSFGSFHSFAAGKVLRLACHLARRAASTLAPQIQSKIGRNFFENLICVSTDDG